MSEPGTWSPATKLRREARKRKNSEEFCRFVSVEGRTSMTHKWLLPCAAAVFTLTLTTATTVKAARHHHHRHHGASQFAPGHLATPPGGARFFAPGHRQTIPGGAKTFAPGHRMR